MRDPLSRVRDRRGALPHLFVTLAVFALMIGQTVNRLWSTPDFWVYLGPVREFAQRPLHPLHPLLAGSAADPYMGPYTFVLGLVTRLTGLDPVDVLAVAGLLSYLLLSAGIWSFTRRFSAQPLAPVLALVFTFVAWGWAPWRWSGYFNLNSIGSGLILGSTFASGVGLAALAAFIDWLRSGRRRHLLFVGLAYPVVLLTHPMTGLWVGLLGLGIFVGSFADLDKRRIMPLAGAIAIAGLIVVLWPFFSLLDLVTTTGDFDGINSRTYRRVAGRSILAAPGFLMLATRLVRRRYEPLALAWIAVALVFVLGWVADRGSLGRVFPGVMITAHVAMADWFSERIVPTWTSTRTTRVARAGLAVIVVAGLAGTAPGWVRGIPRPILPARLADDSRLRSGVEPYLSFADLIPRDAVVAASGGVALAIGASTAKVIASTIPAPFVADNDRRTADVATILDPGTPPRQRRELMSTYRSTWMVVADADADALASATPGAESLGSRSGYTVIRVTAEPNDPAP